MEPKLEHARISSFQADKRDHPSLSNSQLLDYTHPGHQAKFSA